MCALPSPKSSPLAKGAQKIKDRIDALLIRMQKEQNFTPTRDQLEEYAEQLIDYLNNQQNKAAPYSSHVKAAIIDLTEVPDMAPQMQRIAFLTALKDASREMELYLSCL